MNPPFLICEFAKNTLSNLVKESFGSDFPDISKKKQVKYIFNYLTDLGAKTILLEFDYVDRDYLEDYAQYYVKCFSQYGKRCTRLHFFKHDFNHKSFSKLFSRCELKRQLIEKKLRENYLGFIVVKPLPITFIGRTCLKVYPDLQKNNSKNVITQNYEVNLFGVELCVHSIAFQEQDKVIAACATTSIWSALHAIDFKSTSSVPSSSEITLAAINHIQDSSNSFPNQGLTNKQILRALDTQKLRNHRVNIPKFDERWSEKVFRLIKSYIDSHIPVILGADVYVIEHTKEGSTLTRLAGHAVTILGYKDCQGCEKNCKERQKCRALYLHDDRLGPFARARFDVIESLVEQCNLKTDACRGRGICLQEKSEVDDKSKVAAWKDTNQILLPDSLIVPNNHKVRIPCQTIDNTCRSIVEEYEQYILKKFSEEEQKGAPRLIYKIKLEQLSKVRARILENGQITEKAKQNFLTKAMARYLWVATFEFERKDCKTEVEGLAMDVMFDATEIPQGEAVVEIIQYQPKYYQLIVKPFEKYISLNRALPESIQDNFLSSFIKYLKPPQSEIVEYLNRKFGEPRAPKRIKEGEVEKDILQNQLRIVKRYGSEGETIKDALNKVGLCDINVKFIWAIALDGALLIGEDIKVEGKYQGHPTLTGFKPARIAGEMVFENERWELNPYSGRYSTDYDNAGELLENARYKFLEIFRDEKAKNISLEKFKKRKGNR